MRRTRLFLLAAVIHGGVALAFLDSVPVYAAEVTIEGDRDPMPIDYYDVVGSDENSLKASMRSHQPAPGFSGHANWRVEYHYRSSATTRGCEITSATVSVGGRMQLPRWQDQSAASGRLRGRWDAYILGLESHENGHLEHGRAFARELRAALAALPPAPSCGELDRYTHQQYDALLDKYHAIDIEYDRVTEHGRTQGAVF